MMAKLTIEKIKKGNSCPQHGLASMVRLRHTRDDGFGHTIEMCGGCLQGAVVLELGTDQVTKLKKLAEAWVFADRDEARIRAAIDMWEAIDLPEIATAMRLAWVVEKERLDSDDS